MNIKQIEQRFNPTELLVIKRFLAFVNETTKTDSDFADASDIAALNEFSDLAETDEQITQSVKVWLHKKKVRLRGNFTNN